MIIDNSQLKEYQTCPFFWYEKRLSGRLDGAGVELNWLKKGANASEFGKRMHELQEEHYRELQGNPIPPYPEYPLEPVELEAQLTMAAYRNHYPVEPFTVVDVEKTFRVPLAASCDCNLPLVQPNHDERELFICPACGKPARHTYVGKFDVILRDPETGMLSIMDHKTEKRRSQSNNPKAWASRTQGTLYLWAAQQIYGEEFRDLIVNVLTRQSEKGQEPPSFPERQRIQRTPEQMDLAVKGLVRIADEIELRKTTFTEEDWAAVANRNNCMQGNWECEFRFVHLEGWTDEILRNDYRKTEVYLDL